MNTPAFLLMLSTMLLVTGMTSYFFFKVLTSPQKPEPDSFDDHDGETSHRESA